MIRSLTPAEAETAIAWAAAEGWNPGHADLSCFLTQDPGLFLGLEEAGEFVSVIAATRYEADFGFIGFYIVRPDRRGCGHGLAVWTAAMARLAGRVVGLDGVVAQQAAYRRAGFTDAWTTLRFGGQSDGGRAMPGVVAASAVPFATLADFDRRVFPARRDAFLRAWLGAAGHVARVLLRDGAVAGLGVIRPARDGHKIGPLSAVDAAAAESVVRSLLATVPAGRPVFLDVPVPQTQGVALARRLGLAPVFEAARMYAGPAPPLDLSRVFGITSLELG